MELFLLFLQIPLLIIIIKYFRKLTSNALLVNSYYYILSFKVSAGLFLGVLFFNYYKFGDTLGYYYDLETLNQLFYSDSKAYFNLLFFKETSLGFENELIYFRQQRAFVFVQLLSPLYIFTGSNYWMLSVYLSLFSFLGFWLLSGTLIKYYSIKPYVILISFFVFPSIVLWSSGVIKESIILGIMCFLINELLKWVNSKERMSIISGLIFIVFSILLLIIKFYYFAALFAVLIPYCLVKYYALKFGDKLFLVKQQCFVLLLLILISALGVTFLHPLLSLDHFTEVLYTNYTETLRVSNGLNVFSFEGLSPDPLSFLKHIPKAISFGLFGPFLWHCKKLISFVNGIENTLLLVLFITFLLSIVKNRTKIKFGLEEISVCIYVLLLAIFMAFASPNWGTLVRYKIGYLPFFLLLILNTNSYLIQFLRRFKPLNLEEKKS